MKQFVFLLGLLILSMTTTLAQPKAEGPGSMRVDPARPTIYLLTVGDRNTASETTQRLAFRLHNNLKWDLVLKASGAEKEQGDARLFYTVLDENGVVINATKCHVCSIIRLSSGKSIYFTIPKESFRGASTLRLQFAYQWENDPLLASSEPTHFVELSIGSLLVNQPHPK